MVNHLDIEYVKRTYPPSEGFAKVEHFTSSATRPDDLSILLKTNTTQIGHKDSILIDTDLNYYKAQPLENFLLEEQCVHHLFNISREEYDDLPLILKDAIIQYSLQTMREHFSMANVAKIYRYYVKVDNYMASMTRAFSEGSRQIKDLCTSEQIAVIDEDAVYLDQFNLNNPFLLKHACIYHYPFFLDRHRKNMFSVIPVGKQTHVAIIINKDLSISNYENIDKYKNISYENIEEQKEILLNIITKDRIKIYTIKGYIFTSVIAEFTIENQTSHSCLPNIVEITPNHDVIRQITNSEADIAENIGIFLDPVDVHKSITIKKEIYSGHFSLIYLAHNLDIPVGLGFTLPLLPFILKKSLWKECRNDIVKSLGRQNEEEYSNLGIKFDDDIKFNSTN